MMSAKSNLKTVVITGGTRGIGLETAKLLLENPEYRLIMISKEEPELYDTAKELDSTGNRVTAFGCDLTQSSQVEKTVSKILSLEPEIYALVNNAGIYPFGGASNTSRSQWDETFQVNLTAPFFLIQGLLPGLTKSGLGARIVNISSTAGILPNHFALAYSVSKAALIHLTKTLAKELGKDSITVNCVCPGIVRSPMHEAYHRSSNELETFYAKRGATFPLGRVGEPRDIAGAIRFFLSEDASWITGEVCVIDGGRLLM